MEKMNFLMTIIISIVWPIKGIIYMEEQALQWIFAIGTVYLREYGYILLILLGIGLILSFGHYRRVLYGARGAIVATIVLLVTVVINVCLAWFYLIYGAINGRMADTHQPLRLSVRRNPRNRLHLVLDRTNPSLHYRLGRWLYRTFNRLLLHIPRINPTFCSALARVIALVVILWGVWNIPYDLTH